MSAQYIPQDPLLSGLYSNLIVDLLQGKTEVLELYPDFGAHTDWKALIEQRKTFSPDIRKKLVEELLMQYGDSIADPVKKNIHKLVDSNCFTVTTGQQIHVGLGPMYVIHKIASTIQKVEQLSRQYPENQFVPVFWMASEDHDFEEINHFRLFGKEFLWKTEQEGPVGRFKTDTLNDTFNEAIETFKGDAQVSEVLTWFSSVYKDHSDLSSATRFLLNHFFGSQGLVVIEPDRENLKALFADAIRIELEKDGFNPELMSQTERMKTKGYKPQIAARSTNLFLISGGKRQRIDRHNGLFQLFPEEDQFTLDELTDRLRDSPGDFSPNVALRPLYQETILPNLAYVGGPAEVNYWLQLYPLFKIANLKAPALILRFSAVISDRKSLDHLAENQLEIADLFLEEEQLKKKLVNLLQQNNPLPEWAKIVAEITDQINSELYKNKNPGLKDLKKRSDDYLKALIQAIREADGDFLNQPATQRIWKGVSKVKSRYFDMKNPQERNTFFLEHLIQKPDLLEVLRALPIAENPTFWTIWTE